MNRSTLIMVVVFVALVAVWALSGGEKKAEQLPTLEVAGFLKKEISLQDIKILNKDEESPYTRFEIAKQAEGGRERYVIELDPATASAKKAGDKKWWVTRSYGGRTMKVKAENYRLRIYNQALARTFRSAYAFKAKKEELAEYGLDPEHAIEVKATAPKRTVHLLIGSKHKIDDKTPATWVMNPEVEGVVYQISGFDLREHFKAPWKDIRDRKILSINPGRIHKVELVNPRAPEGRRKTTMTRKKLTTEQLAELDKAKKWDEIRKAEAGWTIASPTGFPADGPEIGSWLESLERMSATGYKDLTDGKLPEGTGLDAPDKAVQVTLYDGDTVVKLRIGTEVPKGQEKDVYVQVEGRDAEIYTVAGWMGDQIVMDLDKVRDRRLLGDVKAADAVSLVTESQGERFEATKGPGGWQSKTIIDPKNVTDFLGDLDGIRVEWRSGVKRVDAGLTTPKTKLTLTWADGSKRTLSLAAKRGEDDLAAWESGDVFKLPSWNAGRMHARPRDFVDKHVMPIQVADITSVTLPAGKGGTGTVSLTRTAGAWAVEGNKPLNTKTVDAMMKQLLASEYHAAEDAKPTDVGLAPPAWEVVVKTTNGRTYALRLSDKRKENNPYGQVLVDGKAGPVFTISAMMVQIFRKTYAELKGK